MGNDNERLRIENEHEEEINKIKAMDDENDRKAALKRFAEENKFKLSLEEIERLWIDLGRQPTTTDIKNGCSKYSLHTFERRFGSWRKALEFFVAYMNGEKEIDSSSQTEMVDSSTGKMNNSVEAAIVHKTKRDIGLRMRFLVMQRDDFKCCLCGRSPATTPGLQLHIDHIKPWSKGGETLMENLQTLCSDCNLGKSNL